jgi:hypothetical protein
MNNLTCSLAKRHVRSLVHLPCVVLGVLIGVGCESAETHHLGLTNTAQDLESEPTESTEPFFTDSAAFAGLWIGQAESPLASEGSDGVYRFPSGSTQILLDLRDPMVYEGKLTFGEGEAPPPPTDPDVGYPVGVNYADLMQYQNVARVAVNSNPLPPFEGFAYQASRRIPIDELQFSEESTDYFDVADGVLTLEFSTSEPLQPWCALQTPIAGSNGHFDCAPPFAEGIPQSEDGVTCSYFGPLDNSQCPANIDELPSEEAAPIITACQRPGPVLGSLDCNKAFLCDASDALPTAHFRGVCECDATECFVDAAERTGTLSLRHDGEGLTGVFGADAAFHNERGLFIRLGTVRFQRVK